MRIIPEVVEDVLNILNEAERKEECNGDTLCDINELMGEILAINSNNERKCEECAGCTNWLCDCANVRAKAIDEAMHEAAKAICVGCGYLKEDKCTYKGGNCAVSKPMLESVTEALEQMKATNDLEVRL